MKALLLISVCLAGFYLSFSGPISINSNYQANPPLSELKKKKDVIDKYLSKYKKSAIVYAKVPGKRKLVPIKNEHWPEDVECTYNIFKNQADKIICIFEIPYSESGDWSIIYKHYFDDDGKTFSFSKKESIFDNNVEGGAVKEYLVRFYNDKFKNIGEINRVTDKDDRPIGKNKNMFDFREYEYKTYKNLSECLTGYNIHLKN